MIYKYSLPNYFAQALKSTSFGRSIVNREPLTEDLYDAEEIFRTLLALITAQGQAITELGTQIDFLRSKVV